MSYAIFFDYKNVTYRLPVNPEQIDTSSVQAIQTYEVLSIGQVAVPTHMELKKYTFECELPKKNGSLPLYIETKNKFKSPDYYLDKFQKWRDKLVPVRFIAGQTDGMGLNDMDLDNCIDTLVLITELGITEKAGEEGDKYVSFTLTEYKDYSKKVSLEKKTSKQNKTNLTAKKSVTPATNPKANKYHIVKKGETLWSIAKLYYSDGGKYAKIYNANKDKIKNPNLISVGQKLLIPDVADTKISDTVTKKTVSEATKAKASAPVKAKVSAAKKKFETWKGSSLV